jgi:GMP synthase-like glutamine amidotransferase
MRSLAFIDPFMISPAVNCFNGIVELLGHKTTYHMPSKYGVKSLIEARNHTDAYMIVGSASHVTEPLEWHAPLANFLLEELIKGRPVMGHCFGHQLLCHALGSTVQFAFPNQEKYSGLRCMTMTQDLWDFKKGERFCLAMTHRQIVTKLGEDLMEVGAGLTNDLVAHKKWPLFLTQAHPESSRHFCQNDVQGMDEKEVALAIKDGSALIKRFYGYFL